MQWTQTIPARRIPSVTKVQRQIKEYFTSTRVYRDIMFYYYRRIYTLTILRERLRSQSRDKRNFSTYHRRFIRNFITFALHSESEILPVD